MTVSQVLLIAGCVSLGGLAGVLVPACVAMLPEPAPVTGETKPPYSVLARWRHLPVAAGLAVAGCWGVLAWRIGPDLVLPAVLYLSAAGVLLVYVDLRVRLLPDAVVLPSYPVVGALLTLAAVLSGRWGNLLWALAGGAVLWGFLALLGLLAPSGMGFGDVKFGGVLGLCLGWFGLASVLVGTLFAFVLGGVVSLGLVASGRARLKSAIPFGPFLFAGFLLALLAGDGLAHWYLGR